MPSPIPSQTSGGEDDQVNDDPKALWAQAYASDKYEHPELLDYGNLH